MLAHLSGDAALVRLLQQAGPGGDAFKHIAHSWLGAGEMAVWGGRLSERPRHLQQGWAPELYHPSLNARMAACEGAAPAPPFGLGCLRPFVLSASQPTWPAFPRRSVRRPSG